MHWIAARKRVKQLFISVSFASFKRLHNDLQLLLDIYLKDWKYHKIRSYEEITYSITLSNRTILEQTCDRLNFNSAKTFPNIT